MKTASGSADFRFHDFLHLRINHGSGALMGPLLSRYAAYRTESGGTPDLAVNIGPFAADTAGAFKVDDRIWVKDGYLACEQRYKIARWRLEIRGLESDRTEINIDANMPARVVIAGETVPAMIRYKLARKGAILVHGSAIEKDGRAMVFSGRSGAGKTITSARFMAEGWKHLGDDSCILRQGRVYSFIQPFTIRFTYDVGALFRNPFTTLEKAAIAAKKALSIASLGRINLLTSLAPEKVMGGALGESGSCDRFVLLQGGRVFRAENGIGLEQAVAQTIANLRFESRELDTYLQAYGHVFPRSFPARFWEEQAADLALSLRTARRHRITVPGDYTDAVFRDLADAVGAQ
jgi:hypothetical protein